MFQLLLPSSSGSCPTFRCSDLFLPFYGLVRNRVVRYEALLNVQTRPESKFAFLPPRINVAMHPHTERSL